MCRGRIQRVFAGGFAVFWFYSSRRVPRQRQDFEGRAKGELLCRAVAFFPREVIENFPDAKRFCFADKAPLSSRFEILHLGCRDFRPDERRKPRTYLGVPFAAGRDMATVTWSNLPERLKGMGCGVNFKADA